MKKSNKFLAKIVAIYALVLSLSFPLTVYASTLDELSGNTDTQQSAGTSKYQDDSSSNVADMLKGYTPITTEQMQKAQQFSNPIVNLIGIASGFILTLATAFVFLVTACDLLYIAFPFVRPYLDGGASEQGAGAAGGMGGMGMGGMGGMGMGRGMGGMMGGMGGMGGSAPATTGRRRFISDEALACVALANSAPQPAGGGIGMGGMGMGGMGMGGMMGGMGGQQQAAPTPTKSVILTYFKKRVVFLIFFFVATIVLMSSIFMDCGINLAQMFMTVLNKFNNMVGNVEIS